MDRAQTSSSAPIAVPMPFPRQGQEMATIRYMTGAQPSPYFSKRQCNAIRRMGISQIVMGSFAIIFGIAILGVIEIRQYGLNAVAVYGSGVWTGIFIIITGSFGIAAANKNTLCMITSCMVLNIICSLMAATLLGLSATIVGVRFRYLCGDRYNSNYSSSSRNSDCTKLDAHLAMQSLNLIIGLAQFVITIVSSAICCGAMCCKMESSNPHRVQYNSAPIFTPYQPAGAAVPYPSAGVPYQHAAAGVHYPSAPGHLVGQAPIYFAAPQNFQQVPLSTNGQVPQNSKAQSQTTTGEAHSFITKPPHYEELVNE